MCLVSLSLRLFLLLYIGGRGVIIFSSVLNSSFEFLSGENGRGKEREGKHERER